MNDEGSQPANRRRLTSADFTKDPEASWSMVNNDVMLAPQESPSPSSLPKTSKRKRRLCVIVGLSCLVVSILGIASVAAWYFTREESNKVVHGIGQITLDIRSLNATIHSVDQKQQQVSFGQSEAGALTFSRYCTLDVARSSVKDQQQQYLCLLFSSAKASVPDYRLLIQPTATKHNNNFPCHEVRWDFPTSYGLKDCFSLNNTYIYGGKA